MSDSTNLLHYRGRPEPLDPRWAPREKRRVWLALVFLAAPAAVLLTWSYGGAAWVMHRTGLSGLDSRFTGTYAYIYWLIDVPMRLGAVVPAVVALVTISNVVGRRWRPRSLLILLACFIIWLATTIALFVLWMNIDP